MRLAARPQGLAILPDPAGWFKQVTERDAAQDPTLPEHEGRGMTPIMPVTQQLNQRLQLPIICAGARPCDMSPHHASYGRAVRRTVLYGIHLIPGEMRRNDRRDTL